MPSMETRAWISRVLLKKGKYSLCGCIDGSGSIHTNTLVTQQIRMGQRQLRLWIADRQCTHATSPRDPDAIFYVCQGGGNEQ